MIKDIHKIVRNTDTFKPERVWKCVEVNRLWLSDTQDYYEPEDLIKWATNAQKIAKKQGFTDIHVKCTYTENEYGSVRSQYVVCYGWREETNKEWKDRLKSMINKAKNERDMYYLKRHFYETKLDGQTTFEKNLKKMESLIKTISK